jgi:tryptophan synthase alpha chain
VSRLTARFERLRAGGERALIAYFTAGDPSLETTARLVVEAERRGADVIELGVPFSDPLADGPVIQRASQRALAAGVSLRRILETVAEVRSEVSVPLVLMTYYNPVLAFGLHAFAEAATKAGVDAVIVPDLPPDEAGPLDQEAAPAGLDVVFLAAPTSTPERLRLIARRSRGFIYLVSLTGVTGERTALPRELEAQVRALRLVTTKPVCVGFGISTPEHVAAVGRLADGVIVGSAIVRLVEQHATSPDLVPLLGTFIASLKEPLRTAAPSAHPTSTELAADPNSPPRPPSRLRRKGGRPRRGA